MNKNYEIDTRVTMVRTGSKDLDNKCGAILGKCFVYPEGDYYIVVLDEPLPDAKAVVLVEHCLVEAIRYIEEFSDDFRGRVPIMASSKDKYNWESIESCAHCGRTCRTWGRQGRHVCVQCTNKGLK